MGVDPGVQLRVRGFEPQEIPVGTGFAPGPEIGLGPLAEAERHGQGRLPADPPDDPGHPVRGDPLVLTRLHHDSAVPVGEGLGDANHDLFLRHPVAPKFAVARPDAAVVAFPDAAVGDLNQPPEVDFIAHAPAPCIIGLPPEEFQLLGALLAKPAEDPRLSIAISINPLTLLSYLSRSGIAVSSPSPWRAGRSPRAPGDWARS